MSSMDASFHASSAPAEIAEVLDDAGLVDPDEFARVETRLVEASRWADLAGLYEAAAARSPDPATGRRYTLLAALLWMEKLESPRQAEPRLRRVLASDPEHSEALEALKDLCSTSDRLHEAADLLDRAITVADDKDKPDLLVELAEIVYPALDTPDRALVALRYAYECDPSRLDVVSAARRIFMAERRWADAKRVLDDQAAAVLGDEVAGPAPEAAEATADGEHQDTIDMAGVPPQALTEIGEGYLDLGRRLLAHATEHDLAEACLERARALGHEGALSRLDELAHLRQDWERAADKQRAAGFESRDKQEAAHCYLQAAELVHAYGQDPVRADELVERCLLLQPAFAPALDFLAATHAAHGRLPDLTRRLNGMVAAVRDPTAKVAILLRVARLSQATPSDSTGPEATEEARGGALNAYRRVLAIRPDHREAVRQASALLLEDDRHAERAQILETFLAASTDAYAQVQTHLALGRLYADALGDLDRSRAHFEAVLTRDPANFTAATALRALYKDADEHAAHLGVLRVLLTYAPDRPTRVQMLAVMADVAAAIGPEESFNVLRQTFELQPEQTREALASAADSLNRYLPLAESYVSVARMSRGPQAVDLWMAAGALFDERLPRPRDAVNAYREALRLDGRNNDAREALERLLAEKDDPEALLEVLRSQLDQQSEDDPARVLLLARIAGLLDRELGRLPEAVTTYEQVLALDAQHPVVLANLDDLHRRLEQWEALESVLVRREAIAESDEDLVSLMVRRARLLEGPLDRPDDAAGVYLEMLARAPDHPAVLEGLAALVARGVRPRAIAGALEPIYGQRGQYDGQVNMLAHLAEHEQTEAERAGAARRAAQVAESRLNDPRRAFDLVITALRRAPEHEDLRETLIRLGREVGAAPEVASQLDALIDRQQSPEAVAASAYRLGELKEDALDDADGAIAAYRRTLDADPHHGQALAALERLLGRAERYEELADLLEARFTASDDPAVRAKFGSALATLQDARLQQPETAAETLRTLAGDQTKDPVVLGRLAELLERLEQWRELVGVLERLRDSTDDPDVQASAESKAADVLVQHLADPKGALERYQRAIDHRGDHAGAVRGLVGLLDDVEHRGAAGALLVPIYEASGDWPGLARALQAQLASASGADERRALFLRLVDLQAEALDDAGAAFETLSSAFQEGLLPTDALERLSALAEASNRAKALAQVYEHAVEQADGDLELRRALARLYDGAAGAPTRAKETWQRVLDAVPGDPEALEALERLTAAGDRPEALADVLVARAEAAAEPKEAVTFFRRAAAVLEEAAEDLPRAVGMVERARALAPNDRGLLHELGRYYKALERPEALRDVLAAEAELVDAALERARVLVDLARTRGSLGDHDGAIEAYKGALDTQPDHSAAREGLEAMLDGPAARAAAEVLEPVYRRVGDWSRLVQTYEMMVDQAPEASERVERLVAIRSIYEERLDRPDRAFEAATRAFAEAPEQPEIIEALDRLGRASGNVEPLIDLLQERADQLLSDHPSKLALRAKLADYAEHLLGDQRRAIDIWHQARVDQPHEVRPLMELERLHGLRGEAREQVAVRKAWATLVTTPAERADHLVAAASILEEKLGDRSAAAFEYEQVLVQVPGHDGALQRLDKLYSESRAHTELARVLETAASHRLGARRAEAFLRLAELRREMLEDPRGAVTAYGEVLRMVGADVGDAWEAALTGLDDLMTSIKDVDPELAADAGQRLERHWAAQGQPLKVIAAKEAQIAGTTDRAVRKRLLLEVGQLYDKQLDQHDMAFMCLARAFSGYPEDRELADALDRVAPIAGTEEELADLYAQSVPSVGDPQMALRLARRAANIYDAVLDRPDSAIPMYLRVLGVAEDDPEALAALQRLYERTNDAVGLLRVYRGQMRIADDEAEKDDLWRKVAAVADESDDEDATFEAYRQLLERKPDDLDVLRKMVALCERTGRPEELFLALEKQAPLLEGDDRAQVQLRMGTIARNDLQDDVRAVSAFEAALEARPEDPGAIAGLAALVREEGPARALAAAAVAPVYRASGAFEAYITCLEIQGASTPAGEDRKRLFLEIADVYETRLQRPERAFTWAGRALHEDPTDIEVRAKVETLAEQGQLMEDLAAYYLDELDETRSPELGLNLRRRVAEIYDHALKDPQRAIAEYNRVLDMAPGDDAALEALERLLPEVGEFGSLGDVYRRRIAQATGPQVRTSLLRQFARLQADKLNDAAGAIASLRRLLELAPSDVPALTKLAELCEAEGRTTEMVDTLELLVEAAGPDTPEGRDSRVRLAQVKAGQGDLAGAELLLRAVVTEAADHPGALEFLQERFEDAVAEEDVDVAHRIGELLADALRTTERWEPLNSVLRVRAGLLTDPHERLPLNLEAAELYRDRLEAPDKAFATFGQVLRDSPGLTDVREALEALADRLDLHEPLVDALEAAREQAADTEVRVDLDRRIARLVTARMGDPERAARWWQIVLSGAPDDREALAALDPLFTDLGRWAALTDVLERRVELTEDDAALQFDLLMRQGRIWEEWLGEPEEAVRWYQRARALRSADPSVLSALTRLLDEESHPQALFEVLEALAEQTSDAPNRVRLWARMAKIVDERLDRSEEAIHWWTQVRRINPGHAEALEALERLYERTQQWSELADLLEAQLTEAPDERTMLRLQRRLGLVRGTRLGSVDEAVVAWTEILKRNPNDVEALGALAQIYRESKRWEDLVLTLRKLIPLQTSAEGVKTIRFELAEVFLTQLDMVDEAIESAKRVLDVEPHTVVELKRLEEIFVATGAHGEAVRVMNARAASAESLGQRIEILFDIARVYEEQLGRRAGAAAAYEQILGIEPSSLKAYEALAATYESNGDYRKLGELYNRRLEVTELAEERQKLLFAIVEIQERWLGQPELAFTAACRAFGEDVADESAQALAERLADQTDNWDVLAEVYEEQVDLAPAARAGELRRRLAEIRLEHLEDFEEAELQFRLVLQTRPDDEVARDRLIDLYTQQQRWAALVDQLIDRVDQTAEIDPKMELLHRVAQLQEQELKDVDAAIATLKRVVDLDPDDAHASLELTRIYRTDGRWQPLLHLLERRRERAATEDDQLALRLEIAHVWAQGLKDAPRAIEAYREVLDLSPRYGAALIALEQLLTHEQRWSELVETFEQRVAGAQDDAEVIGQLTKIASIEEERFRDLDRASRTLIRILEVDPEHRPTLMALARVWREGDDWPSLLEVLERQVELTEDPSQKVSLLRQIGEVHLKQLAQLDQAEDAFNRALAEDPEDVESLHALGDLHERHGNWFVALEMLQREAAILGDDPRAVHLSFRAGKINEEMLEDLPAARSAYQQALSLDSAYTPALRALRRLVTNEGRHAEAVQLQVQEARHTDDAEARAELYTQAADTVLREFDDVAQSLRLLDRALEAMDSYVPALRVAGDLLFSEERWTEAEMILERLSAALDESEEQAELGRTFYRLAYISEKMEDDPRALQRYVKAYELEATYLPILEGLAAALLRADRLPDAQRIFHTILLNHRAALTDAEVVDLHFQIGDIADRLGQTDRARASLHKALDLDGHHPPTLRALAALSERERVWEDAYDYRERLIGVLDGDERFDALVQQAQLCEEHVGEPYRAIDAYVEALRVKPMDQDVLRSLARLFEETSQTPRQVETLEQLAVAVDDPVHQRGVLVQLAELHYKVRRDPLAAVAVLNRALDADPKYIDAFQRIEQILYEARNWAALEENYHRMIRRIPKAQRKARLVLWRSLGDLYSKALKNEEGAKTAYEVILSKLDPEDHAVALKLAAIYGNHQETAQQALTLYQRALPHVDDPAQPARRMFELYHALNQLDRAFCALAALILMRAATEDESKAYALLLKRTPTEPQRAMTDTMWRGHILHPLCRNSLAEILSVVYRGAPDLFEGPLRGLSLNRRKERVDLSNGRRGRAGLRYFAVWQQLANAMNVGDVEHYHRPGSTQSPRMYPGTRPVLFAGAMHEIFKSTSSRQMAWMLGRQMATARPELAAVRALPPDEVGALVEGAIRIFAPDGSGVDHTLDARLVDGWRLRIQRSLSDRALRALREPVSACVHKKDMKRLGKFLDGAEHSASRAAMLMCGDVVAAERGLSESDHLVGVSFRARVRQLMLFVLSEEHFLLRERLGLAIPK